MKNASVRIAGIALALFAVAGCGESQSVKVKDDWKRIDPKQYAAMDDVALLKRWVEVDFSGTARKEVESCGGVEAVLEKAGGKLEEKWRKCFTNLILLNDAFEGMGASRSVVTAALDRAGHAYFLKSEMSVCDVVDALPGVAELYGILAEINTPPADMA